MSRCILRPNDGELFRGQKDGLRVLVHQCGEARRLNGWDGRPKRNAIAILSISFVAKEIVRHSSNPSLTDLASGEGRMSLIDVRLPCGIRSLSLLDFGRSACSKMNKLGRQGKFDL